MSEQQQQQQQQIPIDHDFSYLLFADDSNLVERAAPRLGRASPRLGRASPRLGRASPRLGRASPRLGRRTPILAFSHFNDAGRYSLADDGAAVVAPIDDTNESDSWSHERRAAPRLGRSIHVHQQGKQV